MKLSALLLPALLTLSLGACDETEDPAAPKSAEEAKAAPSEKAAATRAPDGDKAPPANQPAADPIGADASALGDDTSPEQADAKRANVRGLPPENPWTAAGPFAAAKFKAGALAITPREAGDGELPHEPEKGIEEDVGTFMGHPTAFGWAEDGNTFVLCVDVQADAPDCSLTSTDGSEESFIDEARMTKALATAKPSAGPTTWAYGGGIQLSWKTKPHASGQTLLVRATASTEAEAVDIATMAFDDLTKDAEVFPELLSLNADGSLLAIVGHGWEGEGSDEFQLRIVGTGWLAAEAYNTAGLALLGKADHKGAADRFIQASVADPTMWKAPFNAACAHAKAGDVRAKATLTEALTRGGDKAKAKALKDEDLASVRGEAWFTALVGG